MHSNDLREEVKQFGGERTVGGRTQGQVAISGAAPTGVLWAQPATVRNAVVVEMGFASLTD